MKKNIFDDGFLRSRPMTAERFLDNELSGSDYDRGALEAVTAEAENVKKAFINLCLMLKTKNILSDAEIFEVAKGYKPDRNEE